MEFWANIINTAMLGTDKKITSAADLPDELSGAAAIILANEVLDREETFLQLASVAFNYRQCGGLPVHNEQITISPSPPESQSYCTAFSILTLKDVLAEECLPLLKFWLQQCVANKRIVTPEIIPALLSVGAQQKTLQMDIAACCGKRGEWLCKFNDAWNFSTAQTSEELWQTGTLEQRRSVLLNTKKSNPALAMGWLQLTWPQEDANTKILFLETLLPVANEKDIPFLESLAGEKSKKVKDEALTILKRIPGSPVVMLYQHALEKAVTLKKEKTLLGFSTKTSLQFHPISDTDDIYRNGSVDKLSNKKEFTDDEFIIYQLVQSVPPSFWETHLAAKPEEIINYFQKDITGKKMIPAMVIAINKFKDYQWAIACMQASDIFYIDIIPLLPIQQQDHYSIKYFDKFPDSIIQYVVQREEEWSVELAKHIFKHTAGNIYQYNRSFYSKHIHLVPDRIAPELEKCTPAEENLRGSWSNISDYILKLLQLKSQITRSFTE